MESDPDPDGNSIITQIIILIILTLMHFFHAPKWQQYPLTKTK